MHLLYISISFLLFAGQVAGQCPTGDVTLSNQELVDSFVADYPNCTEISGDLILGAAYSNSNVPLDISALSNLTSVVGTLEILHTESWDEETFEIIPSSLSGLENITSVKNLRVGYLNESGSVISSPSYFESLEPLSAISGVVDTLWLGGFFSTSSDIPDFSGVTSIDYYRQTEINGLASTPVFPALTSVRDFTVTGITYFSDNALTTVIIPSNLTEVAFHPPNPPFSAGFYIFNNPSLVEIVGGENLTEIFGELSINNNPELESISGFDNIQSVGMEGDASLGVNIQVCKPIAFDVLKNLEATGYLNLSFNSSPDDSYCSEYADSVAVRIGENANPLKVLSSLDLKAYNVKKVFVTSSTKKLGGLYLFADSAISISGFQELDSIPENLQMVTPNLTQLPAFSNLTFIGGALQILFGFTQPGQLLNLQGLNALERVGWLNIQGHSSSEQNMESLDGLQSLDSITNGFQIQYLEHFDDLSALSPDLSLEGSLRIKNNPSLESCSEFEVLCNLISQASSIQLSENGVSCNDPDSVLAACLTGVEEINSAILNAWFSDSDHLHLSLDINPAAYELRLFNILGQEVVSRKGISAKGTMKIELNKTLKTGIYILEYKSENRRETLTLPFIE